MTLTSQSGRAGLFARVKAILLQPTAEWRVIANEPAAVQPLFAGYAAPLAAISAICALVGSLLFGGATFAKLGLPLPVVGIVVGAVLNFIANLVAAFVFGLVVDGLATNFGGAKDRTRAMQTAVYSSTAAWLSGVFLLVPMLGFVSFLGWCYSIFLLYRGLPVMMRAPQEKAGAYAGVVVLGMILVWIVLGAVEAAVNVSTGAMPNFGALMHAAQTRPAAY